MNPMEPMKLRKALPWIITHLLALAAGVWLFRPDAGASLDANAGGGDRTAPGAAAAVEGVGRGATAASGKAPPRPAHEVPSASVHRLAWKALAADGLSRPERLKASAVILRQWVQEDWLAALDTVMKETPDDYELLIHFEDTFRRNPGELWSLIESKRYGVTTARLKNRWLGTIRNMEEQQRREVIEDLPETARKAIEGSMKEG